MPVIYNGNPKDIEYSPYADARIGRQVIWEAGSSFYARRGGGTQSGPRSCYFLSVDNYDGILTLYRVSPTGAVTQLASYQQTDNQEWRDERFWLQCVGSTIKCYNRLTPVERISVTDATYTTGGWGYLQVTYFEDLSAPAGVPASVFGSINALGRRLVT